MSVGSDYREREKDLNQIPPRREVRDQLARLRYVVGEALRYTIIQDTRKQEVLAEMIVAHLYANGAVIERPFMLVPPVAPAVRMLRLEKGDGG